MPDPNPAPAAVSPTARTVRSVIQAIIGFCVALPTALALVPIPDKYQGYVALALGIAAALPVVVSGIQNAIETRRGAPLIGGTREVV